jgi:hypothetical protein
MRRGHRARSRKHKSSPLRAHGLLRLLPVALLMRQLQCTAAAATPPFFLLR